MRAIILAAGFGTRLGDLSDERPKPLLPVCDIPLIRYAVALLRGHGVTEIAVNLHHHGDLIERELGPDFHYSREETILGTGGGLRRIADWLTKHGTDSFLVVNGKILIDADVSLVMRRHRERDAAATMVLRETPDAAKWGAIEVGEDDRVTKILDAGTPGAHVCMFTGVHCIAPRLVERLPPGGESDSIRQAYIPALRDGDRIEGIRYAGYFHEHSTPARYLEGNWNVLRGRAQLTHPPGAPVHISPTARVDGSAVIGDDVVVGARCEVGPRARLDRVVMWPDSHVDEPLEDAIVTPRGIHRVGGNDGR
jgi:NDP-sugar pyrophosphorylase family protein